MKKNLLITILCLTVFSTAGTFAQVPNGGFENWTTGNPDDWLCNNAIGFAVPVTAVVPAYSGNFSLQGEVLSTGAGNFVPLIASTDLAGNGFAVTQAYTTLSFYYKLSVAANEAMTVALVMYDAASNAVGSCAMNVTGNVSSFTSINIPIDYFGSNPAECLILVTIDDTITGAPVVGSYFIIDGMTLSGLASVEELQVPAVRIDNIQPNPVSHSAAIHYTLSSKNKVQFELFSLTGQKLHEKSLSDVPAGKHQEELDASSLAAGLYFLKMSTSSGSTFRRLQVVH